MKYDVAVVGAGLTGCFTARSLRRYNLKVALFESREDVCLGISKANTAVVYAGYDNRPGSLKARLCTRGNRNFGKLCEELDVPFSRCGSLMLSYGEAGDRALEKKLRHGIENGVEGLRIVTAEEASAIEPELGPGITSALYAPSTGTVNPWELGTAAYESAIINGADVYLNTEVQALHEGRLATSAGSFEAKLTVDCSGLSAGKLGSSKYYVSAEGADYIIIDKTAAHMPHMVLFEQSEIKCRGITAVPTVEGSLLLGPSHRELGTPGATCAYELENIERTAKAVLPDLEMKVIRSFSAVRPNPESRDGEDLHDFVIDEQPDIISLVGIKTPGITCADELGKYVADICAATLGAQPNPDFNPRRKGPVRVHGLSYEERDALIRENPDYGEIVCICGDITKAEVLEAIKRGAVTPEGVKHRCGAMMGRCQGSRCLQKIMKIMGDADAEL